MKPEAHKTPANPQMTRVSLRVYPGRGKRANVAIPANWHFRHRGDGKPAQSAPFHPPFSSEAGIMKLRPYREIDVFTGQPYLGNPLAVVMDASGLDAPAMQQFTRWTNLSEASFLLPPSDPGADYQVRIFTPYRELPFAGHPTLGSCHAWLAGGGAPRSDRRIVQQCGVGLVELRRDGTRLAFAAPPLARAPVDDRLLDAVLAALGLARGKLLRAQWLENGPRWLGLLLDSAETVLALEPDHAALKSLCLVGVIGPIGPGPGPAGSAACDFEVRAFAAGDGIPEDPVTGSLNAALGQWLIGDGLAPERYRVAQGTRLQRAGRVDVLAADGKVWIGGDCADCVSGTVRL
jgi:PhzF family phenazine biosynthesis protein